MTNSIKTKIAQMCRVWRGCNRLLWVLSDYSWPVCVCVYSRPAVALIRKLIAVLESIERLPLHLYDTPGSSYNLQVSHRVLWIRCVFRNLVVDVWRTNLTLSSCAHQILTRRLRFRLERAPGETALIDRTGRMLKMEPLATVESLEQYLLKMVRTPPLILL